ncbi:MAG: glutathione synthase [Quisquiliibacterium sp.]
MRIVFIIDPLEQLKAYKDSTVAMIAQAQARGHEVHTCEQGELWYEAGTTMVRSRRIHIIDASGQSEQWQRTEEDIVHRLSSFDAVLMRKDPPFDMEYVYSTYLLEIAQREGAKVFNDPRAIRDHNEKLSVAEFPQFTPPTIVTRDPQKLRDFVAEHREAVFKLLDGMGGTSIFRARADDPNLSVIIETLNEFGARSVMAQGFIPQISDGDKRVLLIGGKVVPYCLARIPKEGEFRGNLAAGGRGVARELSASDRAIGEALAPVLWSRGLLLVGLDVIGDRITEINVTSPTCFREIEQQTGFNVAAMFIESLEAAVAAG